MIESIPNIEEEKEKEKEKEQSSKQSKKSKQSSILALKKSLSCSKCYLLPSTYSSKLDPQDIYILAMILTMTIITKMIITKMIISNPCGCYVCDSCRNIENDKREIMINDTTNDTTDNDTINDNVIHHRLKNIKQWVYNNIINQLFE